MSRLWPCMGLLLLCLTAWGCGGPSVDSEAHPDRSEADYALLDVILQDHVRLGTVDYVALKRDPRFPEFLDHMAEARPSPHHGARGHMAYWMNAYNAFVIKGVADAYPVGSVREIGEVGGGVRGLFRSVKFSVGGEAYALDVILHKILRPEHREPRILLALSPGTLGGPRLRSSAYHPTTLEKELDEAARAFINDPGKVSLNRRDRVLNLSSIFDWFKEDFLRESDSLQEYVSRYLPSADVSFLQHADVTIRFMEYDWGLNDAAADPGGDGGPAASPEE
jgi:hypothetical protein